ncbi:MAG TPA: glycosyltransferase family 39 protein [Anaerolineae bacterium]|nr:glycosyltransferase family 39 protein [Anaerolineae bacterium]
MNFNLDTLKQDRKQQLMLVLLFALFVRLLTAFWLGNTMEVLDAGGTHDQVSYDMLAHRIADGHGFTFPEWWYPWVPPNEPTSYYSGTMVLHLAALYKLFGYNPLIARILYAFWGTGIVYLVYLLGRRLFGETAGLLSALVAGGYAYLILYSAVLLTETPFIFSLLLALHAAYTLIEDPDKPTIKWLIILGIGLAGGILFRMAVLPYLGLLTAWVYIMRLQTDQPLKLWQFALPIGIIALLVMPWTIRNYVVFDRFMLLESQFGHVLWNSNHPDQGTQWSGPWVAPIPADLWELNEVDRTYEMLERGRAFILDDIGRFIQLTISRFIYFFTFWPTAESSLISNVARVLSFGVTLPFMLYGLFVTRDQWLRLAPIYLFLLSHVGIYVISWVMIRYRIPADTVLILFVGPALLTIYNKLTATTTQTS